MIYNLLHSIAQSDKDRKALVFESESYTYGEILKRVNSLYEEVVALDIKNSNICLVCPNRPEALFLFFAIAKSSNRLTPIDYFSSPAEVRDLTKIYRVDYIVCHHSLLEKMKTEFADADPVIIKNCNSEYSIFALSGQKITTQYKKPGLLNKLFGRTKEAHHVVKENEDLIYFSSSGSSGVPKVFPLSHSQLYHQLIQVRDNFKFTADDTVLCALHYSHNHAICLVFSVLSAGGCAHLIPVQKALAPYISKYIFDHQITLFSHVPLIYKAFVDVAKHLNTDHLRSLRMAICGSAPLSAEVAASFYEKFGKHLHQSYGLSEIGPVCVNLFVDGNYDYKSVGKIFPEIDYKIIDDHGNAVQSGEEGHLLMKGKSMTRGYLNNDAANELMFKDGWMHSQDIVTEDKHGNITIVGRRSNFINVGGLKVFPAEIERVIMNMQSVKEVAVAARKDEFFGQVAEAYIVAHDEVAINEADVKAYCNEHLSSFKIPQRVIFLDEMPKNGIGKIISSKLGKDEA